MAKAQKGVANKVLETLVREYGQENVSVDGDVATVRVKWTYTPPQGETVEGTVDVTLPLTVDAIARLVAEGTYTEEQVLAYFRRGAVLAATQAARQAAQRGANAQESLRRQLERLAEKARLLGVDLSQLLS